MLALKSVVILIAAFTSVSVLAGCSAASHAGVSLSASRRPSSSLSGSIIVDAASSLSGTFDSVAADFEHAHPGATVTFNYGGSGDLAAAIVAGAPVDVFAAASPATMTTVSSAGLVEGAPTTFVKNELEIVTPAGNPGTVKGLADFADAAKKIALCEPTQPCGAAAAAVFAAAGITPAPDTLEPNVKAALTAVELNQVDAAMVYRTDVLAGGTKVVGIPFPTASNFVVRYPIAPIHSSKNPRLAAAFVAYVLGTRAQATLNHAGFITH